MKKFFIILAIIFIAGNGNLNAQKFIGGGFGLNATVAENPKAGLFNNSRYGEYLVGFSVAPTIGRYFNEKFAFGVDLAFGVDFVNTWEFVVAPDGSAIPIKQEGNLLNWRIAPFLRYAVFTHNKFSLMLQGSIGIGGEHANFTSKILYFNNPYYRYSIIGVGIVNIVPVLSYKLSDKFQ